MRSVSIVEMLCFCSVWILTADLPGSCTSRALVRPLQLDRYYFKNTTLHSTVPYILHYTSIIMHTTTTSSSRLPLHYPAYHIVLYNTVQHCTVQYSTLQYYTKQYVQYSTSQYSIYQQKHSFRFVFKHKWFRR